MVRASRLERQRSAGEELPPDARRSNVRRYRSRPAPPPPDHRRHPTRQANERDVRDSAIELNDSDFIRNPARRAQFELLPFHRRRPPPKVTPEERERRLQEGREAFRSALAQEVQQDLLKARHVATQRAREGEARLERAKRRELERAARHRQAAMLASRARRAAEGKFVSWALKTGLNPTTTEASETVRTWS